MAYKVKLVEQCHLLEEWIPSAQMTEGAHSLLGNLHLMRSTSQLHGIPSFLDWFYVPHLPHETTKHIMQIVGSCLFNHNFLHVSLKINLIAIAKLYVPSETSGIPKSHKCAISPKVCMKCLHHVGMKHGPLRSMQSY